jgi:hypothetical protein
MPVTAAGMRRCTGRGACAQVLRTLALTSADALGPFLGELVPCIVGLVQQTLGPTKLAAERTLARILHVRHAHAAVALRCPVVKTRVSAGHEPCTRARQMDQGAAAVQEFLVSGAAGSISRMYLTEAAQRRLSRLPLSDEEDSRF